MARRAYSQPCSLACALDSIGERWALLVVRELTLGPLRFSDLAKAVGGAPTDVLTKRLRELEDDGVIERRQLPAPASVTVYELTEFGRGLERPMIELARWGMGLQRIENIIGVGPSSLANGLRVILQPPSELQLELALKSEGESYLLSFNDGWISASRTSSQTADLTLTGAPMQIIATLLSPQTGDLGATVDGDQRTLDQLREVLEIPPRLRHEAMAYLQLADTIGV